MTHLKKNLLRVLAAALALALCLGIAGTLREDAAALAETSQEYVSGYPYTTVTNANVNLRKGRSVSSELIRRIPEGAEITVKSKNGSWVEVEYGSYAGWVRYEYVELKTIKKVKVTATPTPVPTLSPEEDAGGYNVLKRGASGTDVRSLQEAMIELGYLSGYADGSFGASTEKAVIAFQRKNLYPDTGLVDATLQAYLYSGKPINAKGEAVKITTLSPVPGAIMKLNNTGALVGEVQQQLKNLGYYTGSITNKYDSATKKAVTAFQKKNGLKADGLAGAETRSLLASGSALGPKDDPSATPGPTATPTPVPTWDIPASTVQNGSEGNDAMAVQLRLQELGYYRGMADGVFGRASVNALKSFQTNNGLTADGKAGKTTYAVLFSIYAVPFTVTTEAPSATPAPDPTPTPVSAWTTLREGDTGVEVMQLQENLNQLGYSAGKADGSYGSQTVEAVKAFQKNNALTADGVAGSKTLKLLYGGSAQAAPVKAVATPAADSKVSTVSAITSSLKRGSTGSEVKTLQAKLIELGYLTGKADGVYGKKTASAVLAFQKDNRLAADGIAGRKTLKLLETASPKGSSDSKDSDTSALVLPTPSPTPAPTMAPGATAALTGRPNASLVVYANWYTTVKEICKRYPYVTVYDYNTGISWQIHIFSVGAHADFEPVTANDTTRMRRAFGDQTTWTPKPVWVVFPDGSVYMASTHDTPHGTSHNQENNFAGHACLHFPRTQAQVEAIGPYATSHQETIDKGWAETRKLAN